MKVYIGIDWSECKHDLTFLNEHGQLLLYITVAHTETGLLEMERARQKLNVAVEECVIGLETAHTQGKSPRWTKCCPICSHTPGCSSSGW